MKPALKIALIYLLVGVVWILLSDRLLLLLFSSDQQAEIAHFQTLKGLFYVFSTALLLWLLARRFYRQIEEKIEELERLNRKLEASNAELEQFAFAASHDLQEPLRTISSFVSRLKTRYEGKLDERAQQYIGFAVQGTARMRQIILDLIEFTRVGKEVYPVTKVVLKEVFQEVEHMNLALLQSTKGTVTYGQLPKISCVRSHLVLIFHHLIQNALQHHHQDRAPVVKVMATLVGNFWEISVSDNGIGIESIYFEKIFKIFQRLHHPESSADTGMGLAIVKKAVECLGGSVQVTSQLGVGSTFTVRLPV